MSSFFEDADPEEHHRVERAAARRTRRNRRLVSLVLGVFVLLAVAAYVGVYRYSVDRVPLGTRVEGVPIGGLSTAAAEQRLRERLGPNLVQPLTFVHERKRFRLVPAEAGFRIDYLATVRAAGGDVDSARPERLWDFLAGGGAVEPVVHVDETEFHRALRGMARKIGRPLVEGSLDFTRHGVRPDFGQAGLSVDTGAMRRAVTALIFDPVEQQLPVTRKRPYVRPADVRRALRTFGRPAMSGPVTVVIAGQSVVVPPRVFGPLLEMVPNGHRLVPLLDGDRLDEAMQPLMRTLGPRPRNATVRIVHGRPKVRPAVIGVSYDADQLGRKFLAHLRHTGRKARTFQLHAAVQRPDRSTAEVRSLGIREQVGHARVSVDRLADTDSGAVDHLDGVLLRPGESLDVSGRLGEPADSPLVRAVLRAAANAGYPAGDGSFTAGGRYGVLVDAAREDGRVVVTLWSGEQGKPGKQHQER